MALYICTSSNLLVLLFFRYDLMCWCWQNDTVERPSFQTIYKFLVITHKVRVVFCHFNLRTCTSSPCNFGEVLSRFKSTVKLFQKFQSEECFSNDQCNEDRSSPRYCSKVFNEEESSPLMLIDEICRGGMWLVYMPDILYCIKLLYMIPCQMDHFLGMILDNH